MNRYAGLTGLILLLASCGGSTGSTRAATSGDATSEASDVALESASGAMGQAAGTGLSASGATSAALTAAKNASFPVNESFEEMAPCASGSGSLGGSVKGTVTADDKTGQISAVDIDVTMTGTMTDCAVADDSSTDFDESDITISGTFDGTGSVTLVSGQLSMDMSMSADMTLGGSACVGGGSMMMSFTGTATAPVPDQEGQEPEFSGTVNGTVSGTACGTTINCTISGDFDNPTVSGTGCQ